MKGNYYISFRGDIEMVVIPLCEKHGIKWNKTGPWIHVHGCNDELRNFIIDNSDKYNEFN